MKTQSIVSSIMLLVAVMMLSGCIFPYWEEGGRDHGGGGYKHDNGRRGHR